MQGNRYAIAGNGYCQGIGVSTELHNGEVDDPEILDLVEYGDVIHAKAVALQEMEAAVGRAPAPGPASEVASGG